MFLTTKREIENVLREVTFAPSCVDMDWTWEVRQIDDHEVGAEAGFLLRTTFRRPDRAYGGAQGFELGRDKRNSLLERRHLGLERFSRTREQNETFS